MPMHQTSHKLEKAQAEGVSQTLEKQRDVMFPCIRHTDLSVCASGCRRSVYVIAYVSSLMVLGLGFGIWQMCLYSHLPPWSHLCCCLALYLSLKQTNYISGMVMFCLFFLCRSTCHFMHLNSVHVKHGWTPRSGRTPSMTATPNR